VVVKTAGGEESELLQRGKMAKHHVILLANQKEAFATVSCYNNKDSLAKISRLKAWLDKTIFLSGRFLN
jgi:hypothetical protein